MLKKLLLTVVGLALILVTAAMLVPYLISADQFKQSVMEEARNAIGHPLSIKGQLRFKVFPFIGVYMENVIIGSTANKQKPLATFKSMNVDVDTFAILGGNIVIKSMVLDTPVFNLAVDAIGKANWTPVWVEEKKVPVNKAPKDSKPEDEEIVTTDSMRGLRLEDVRVTNGSIHFQDFSQNSQWQASNINATVVLSGAASPFVLAGSLEFNAHKVTFETKLETLQTFLSTQQANIGANITSDLLSVEARGKIKGSSFDGTTGLASPSITSALAWLSGQKNAAEFASPLPLKLSSNTACSANACTFSKASLTLDSIEAQGDVKTRFSGPVPYVEIKLDTNELDLNLFMPKQKQAMNLGLVSDAQAAEGWDTTPMDFSALRNIELVSDISAKGIKIKNIKIGKTVMRSKIQRGRLSTDIIDAEFYGGKANIHANVDTAANPIAVDKRISFSNIQMEPFLKDIEATDRFSGKADVQMSVAGHGNSQQEIVSSLQGNGSIKCADGSIKGVNIADMVRNVQAAFKQVDSSAQKTDFSEINGTFTIAKGIVSNSDLMMKAPLFRVTGKGTVNLPQQTINYRLSPQVVETIQGQGGKEKQGLGVPVIIEGSLDNPRYRPDLEGAIQEAIKDPEKLKEQLKGGKEAIKDLKQQFKESGGLKGLFKKKEPAPAPVTQP